MRRLRPSQSVVGRILSLFLADLRKFLVLPLYCLLPELIVIDIELGGDYLREEVGSAHSLLHAPSVRKGVCSRPLDQALNDTLWFTRSR